jgi:hypothetical protein
MIMVQGWVVYQGDSKQSMNYFKNIGFPVPPRSNPTDFYMKTMNKEGIEMKYMERGVHISDDQAKAEFTQLVEYFKGNYKKTPLDIHPTINRPIVKNPNQGYLPFVGQVYYITVRSLISQFRNPLDVGMRFAQIIFQAVIGIILFYKGSDIPFNQIQNAEGAIFYLLSCVTFSGIFANLAAFNMERSVFIR